MIERTGKQYLLQLVVQGSHFVSALVVSFALAGAAVAGTTSTEIEGYFNRSQENECLHLSKFYYLADCSYSNSTQSLRGNSLVWVGPTSNAVYFEVGSKLADPLYIPQAGDDRYRPPMTGTISIDDQDTEDSSDDVISGTLVVGAAVRSLITNIPEIRAVRGGGKNAQPRAVHSWKSITHTLAPSVASQIVENEHGGLDYVIASKGFPNSICLTERPDDCFPAEYARKIETGPEAEGDWSAPGNAPIASVPALGTNPALGVNTGTSTTAVVEEPSCSDNVGGDSCAKGQTVWGSNMEDFGLDNIVLKVATDDSGKVVYLQAFWAIETRIDAGPPVFQPPAPQANSWTGGYMEATRTTAN